MRYWNAYNMNKNKIAGGTSGFCKEGSEAYIWYKTIANFSS